MSKRKKVILYARFSPRPNALECDSIAKQLERLRAWCFAMDYEIVAEYSEGLEKAVAHACKIRGILAVCDLSRLSRDAVDAGTILRRLDRKKAELASLVERIDTTTAVGRCMFNMLIAFAQLQREQTADRTSGAMRRYQSAGRRMGRPDRCPFGYKVSGVDPDVLEQDEAEQSAILKMKEFKGQGMTPRGICIALDDAKIPRRGKTWAGAHRLVEKILSREERK